jgi:predicted MPP superfamily phosphohydrolase
LLLNSHEFIRIGNDSIVVAGVENWGATRRFQRLGNVEKALKGAENVDVQLLLSHDPSYWDIVISKKHQNIDLTFSGHTHGGQIGIVTKYFSWSPSSLAYPHWAGLYENSESQNRQYIYVNPGLGNILYSGRIGMRPEITLIILKKN